MRVPVSAAAGAAATAVAALGLAGLIRGAMPLTAAGQSAPSSSPIVVSGAYVLASPGHDDTAAAYFTVRNTTGTADRLVSVVTDVGGESALRGAAGGPLGRGGLAVPAHSSVTLSPGKAGVTIDDLYRPLRQGRSVTLELDFARAGMVRVTARVLAPGAATPTSR